MGLADTQGRTVLQVPDDQFAVGADGRGMSPAGQKHAVIDRTVMAVEASYQRVIVELP